MLSVLSEIFRFWEHNLFLLSATGLAIVSLERSFGKESRRSKQEDAVNLIFTFANPLLVTPVMVWTSSWIVTLLWTSHTFLLRSETGTVAFVGSCIAASFIDDFVAYFRHRLTHTSWLWPIHSVHHSSKVLSWLSNERFHPLNTILNRMVGFAVLFGLGFGTDVVATVALVRHIVNLLNHSNVPLSYGPLNYVFASPSFHRWHHSTERPSCNYSVIFSCIDWAFGTFYLPKKCPQTYGVSGNDMPSHYIGLLVWPLRRRVSAAAKSSSLSIGPDDSGLPVTETMSTGAHYDSNQSTSESKGWTQAS